MEWLKSSRRTGGTDKEATSTSDARTGRSKAPSDPKKKRSRIDMEEPQRVDSLTNNFDDADKVVVRRRTKSPKSSNSSSTGSGSGSGSGTVQTRLFSPESQFFPEPSSVFATTRESSSLAASKTHLKRGNSLFGMVMQRTSSLSDNMTTPVKKKTSRQNNNQSSPRTPSQRIARQLASPGGFGLLKMLQKVATSTSPMPTAKQVSTSDADATNVEDNVIQEGDDDWKESPLETVLDWTLRSRVRMECHPPTCLPDLSNPAAWKRAISYWQHPASAPTTLVDNKDVFYWNSPVETYDSDQLAEELVATVKRSKLQQSEPETDARYAWQDAFSSLYQKWLDRVTEEQDNSVYFVVAIPNQPWLVFRTKTTNDTQITPMIVLTKPSSKLIQKLSSMELTLSVLSGTSANTIFATTTTTAKTTATNTTATNVDSKMQQQSFEKGDKENETTAADLEALRRAQAFGQTAGADVTVKMRRNNSGTRSNVAPDLYLQGYNDCVEFCTLLLNLHYPALPTLWTQNLGPFSNATYKSLSTIRRRVTAENSTLVLQGPILPSLVTEMMKSTVDTMMVAAAGAEKKTLEENNDNGLGSHYFVLQTEEVNETITGGGASAVDVAVWDITRPEVVTFKPK